MQKKSVVKKILLILCLISVILCVDGYTSFSQSSIGGSICVNPGVSYRYSISSYYSGSANFTFTISGGLLSTGGVNGSHTGPGVSTVDITWMTVGGGAISLMSPGGNIYLNSIRIVPGLVAGTITSGLSQNITYNTIPLSINCGAATGGPCTTPTYVYQWQQSPDNINFFNVSGATSLNFIFSGAQTATSYYRRFVTETTTGNNAYSNVASIIIIPPNPILPVAAGSIIPATQNINYNANGLQLYSIGVGRGTYAYSYQWQSSADNISWSNVPSKVPTYTPANLTSTTYFRVAITSNSSTSYSSSSIVNVYPQLIAGASIPSLINIAPGGNPGGITVTPSTGGNGVYTYQWQSSGDGINFTNIANATLPYYNPGMLTANMWYKVVVTSNGAASNSTPTVVSINSTAPDLNSIRVRNILKAGVTDSLTATALSSVFDVSQATQYFDGLGREVQTVAMQQSPLQKDVVSYHIYDDFGRESYSYLPYVSGTNDGNYKATALSDQYSFNTSQFPGEHYFYGQNLFEPSPLNRINTKLAPGNSWQGSSRGINMQYQVNLIADSVRLWNINSITGSIPTTTSTFPAGTLYKNSTADEAGHQAVEYLDMEGKVILRKVQLSAAPGTAHIGWLCTYYVYDIMDHLRFVIQPQAVAAINGNWNITDVIANELCFRYEYDQRNRMIIKKIPGSGEVWMVFDMRDRLVMTQDSSLRLQGKWLTTKYDTQNRPDSSGLLADAHGRTYHQAFADNNIYYPTTTNGFELITRSFYDDYNWTASGGVGNSIDNTNTGNGTYFITGNNIFPTYAVPIKSYNITRGMSTGSQTKVIGSTNQYLYISTFYDDRGKPIQTQSINYTGGLDVSTTQYNFVGKALRSMEQHHKNGANIQSHIVVTKMNYDAGGRLITVYKNIDNAVADQLIATNSYNELGQLQNKTFGNDLESLFYNYNVRGWLSSINKNYISGTAANYFGMELGYDKTTSVAGSTGYITPQYNGNIEGTVWKSKGDGIARKYDFLYDNVNRLTAANFSQNTSGTGWDKSYIDFTVNNLSFDANGNILSMNQKGFKINGSGLIDSLKYTYQTGSNKLSKVDDYFNDPASKLGDFHYTGTKQPTDYKYDGNGNLITDNNKSISSITYNYLNLPNLVTVTGKGTVTYTYDAAGSKLKKTTVEGNKTTTTLYINNFVYQNDTLQFVGHEEGRARWALHHYINGSSGYGFEYDFFLKDHLGNTRMVLTQEKDTTQYIATMESAYRSTENALFYNIPQSSYPRSGVAGYPTDNTTVPNDSLARVNGSKQKTGSSILLRVMSGDKVDVAAKSFYKSGGTALTSNSILTDVLTSLAGGIVTATSGSHGLITDLTNSSTGPLYSALNSFLPSNAPATTGKPKAYLNWILLDDQFKGVPTYPQSGAIVVGNSDVLNTLAYSGIPITKNGYLYIWVSNETPGWDVFFDNLSIKQYSGPITEETHYYPFGLTMAGISGKAAGKLENKKNKFQNQEYNDDLGVDMYEFRYRMDDPQTGRFWQIDPLADKYVYNSTYAFSENKVIADIELEGRESININGVSQIGPDNGSTSKDLSQLDLNLGNLMRGSTTTSEDEVTSNHSDLFSAFQTYNDPTSTTVNDLTQISSVSEITSATSGALIEGPSGKLLQITTTNQTNTVNIKNDAIKSITTTSNTSVTTLPVKKLDLKNNLVIVGTRPTSTYQGPTITTLLKLDKELNTNLSKLSPKLSERAANAIKSNNENFRHADSGIKDAFKKLTK